MRSLGDRYVRDEFDRHRSGKTTAAQWRAFHTEWSKCEPGCPTPPAVVSLTWCLERTLWVHRLSERD
jgi:hypothetical protein